MVSVVVPTYNREDCLFKMLQSLDKQHYQNFEVLVIDQSPSASDTKISKILSSCKNVTYFQIDKQGRCLAKNFAISKVKGEVILFCDDDIIADENFVGEHARIHYELPQVGAASCHLIEPHEEEMISNMPLKITTYGRFINKPNSIYNGYVSSLNGGNMSFKKEGLKEVGYFEENLKGTSMLEEPDIAFRLQQTGYKIYFSSLSKVRHFPQHNGNVGIKSKKLYEWQKDYYFNQFFFMFRNKRTKYLPLIFVYLIYRTFFTAIKNRIASLRYILLPLSAFKEARNEWKIKRSAYGQGWYTPCKTEIQILKHILTHNAVAPQ